jgi:hypothetical protein
VEGSSIAPVTATAGTGPDLARTDRTERRVIRITMRIDHQSICLAACFLIAGAGGYCFQALYDRPVSALTAAENAGADYFLTVRSFSEVDNARALMEAIALRSLNDLRTRRIATRPTPADSVAPDTDRDEQLAAIVRDFRAAIREFGGTGQEMLFVRDLLGIFKREGWHEEWISLYLDHLYRDPTHEWIGHTAREALVIGKAAQREQEVFDALNHLRRIPLEFEAKPAIESVLASSVDSLYLARSETAAAWVGPED